MEQDKQEQDKQEAGAAAMDTRKPRRRGWIVAGSLAVLALGGIGAATAVSAGGGRFAGGPFGGGPFAGHGIDRALEAVDASPEQEKRIWAIIDATRAELRPLGREFRDARGTVKELLGAGNIDRAAVEKLRAERIAAIDAASRKLTEAVVDAAEVLTPEQRAKLASRFEERGFGRPGFDGREPRR